MSELALNLKSWWHRKRERHFQIVKEIRQTQMISAEHQMHVHQMAWAELHVKNVRIYARWFQNDEFGVAPAREQEAAK